MRSKALIFCAVLATVGGAVTACSSDDDSSDSGELLGSVETMFGTVDVPQPDGDLRVVALGWSDADTALSLGVQPVAVYDWQGFGEENKGVGPWAEDDFGDSTPTVIKNDGQALNYEQIQGFDPDLILNVSAIADKQVYDRLATIAPTIYAPEGTADFATPWDVHTRSVAEAVGETDKGEDLIDDVQGQITQAADDNPNFSGYAIASGTKFGDAYGAYLAGDTRFDLVNQLGFIQNPPIEDLEASGFYANVPAEKISALDADVSIFLPIGYTLEQTTSDQLIASLDSVKDNRAIFIDPDTDFADAWGAGSILSIPFVLDELVPQLKTVMDNVT